MKIFFYIKATINKVRNHVIRFRGLRNVATVIDGGSVIERRRGTVLSLLGNESGSV